MLTYQDRIPYATNSCAKNLLQIMANKQTNLAVSLDVTNSAELLQLTTLLAPYICVLKTHIDILTDFTPALTKQLTELADKHQFLIFEDRKFADIGNTVSLQYGAGIYHIAEWAHITNAHTVPGPGVIAGLKQVGLPKERGLLLLAEMSSNGNLARGEYADATFTMAQQHKDFVIGFIAQRKLSDDPGFIYLTPGVQLTAGDDALGQQYTTPQQVILQQQSDVIIVGRGIYQADDPIAAAKLYQAAGWEAYLQRLKV